MTVAPVIMWAVLTPPNWTKRGVEINAWDGAHRTRAEATRAASVPYGLTWRKLYSEGWRCVQVEVSAA